MSDDPEQAEHVEKKPSHVARQRARAAIPAVYVDTWSAVSWKGHVRIVLGEWVYREPNYRAAFLMELTDAKRLAEYLLDIVEERQKEEQKVEGE